LLLFTEYKVEGVRAEVDLSDAKFRCANFKAVNTASINQLITQTPKQKPSAGPGPYQFVKKLAPFTTVLVNASF